MRHLVWGRISWFSDGVVFDIPLSKTIQFQQRVHQVALARIDGSIFCPVRALESLAHLRGGKTACSPQDLVFLIPRLVGVHCYWDPLTKPAAQKVLESQISQMGLDPSSYRFHSFRHGSLQEAVLVEPSLELVRLQSDHVSTAVHAYTNLPGSRRFGVSKKVGSALQQSLAGTRICRRE